MDGGLLKGGEGGETVIGLLKIILKIQNLICIILNILIIKHTQKVTNTFD